MEKDRLQDPLQRAQEAMTKAVARECPSCKKAFVKHDGCNKMKCTCNALSCYLCGSQIRDYSHFCACPGGEPCKCRKKCKLFTSTQDMEKRDQMARYDAGTRILREAGFTKGEIQKHMHSLEGTKTRVVERKDAKAVMQIRRPVQDHRRLPVQRQNDLQDERPLGQVLGPAGALEQGVRVVPPLRIQAAAAQNPVVQLPPLQPVHQPDPPVEDQLVDGVRRLDVHDEQEQQEDLQGDVPHRRCIIS